MGSFTHNATAQASGLGTAVARQDLRFVADLSRRMQWDAQQATDPDADFVREHIAAGTLGALVWLLDITDVAPATGRILRLDRSPAAIDAERSAAQRRRALERRDNARMVGAGRRARRLGLRCRRARIGSGGFLCPEPLRAGPLPRPSSGAEQLTAGLRVAGSVIADLQPGVIDRAPLCRVDVAAFDGSVNGVVQAVVTGVVPVVGDVGCLVL